MSHYVTPGTLDDSPDVEIHSYDANRLAASMGGLVLALLFGAGWRTTFEPCTEKHPGCICITIWRPTEGK